LKALVTGGGGFLGSAIVRLLRARGDDVVVVARGDYPELKSLPRGVEGESLAAIAKAVDAGELSTARTLAGKHLARADLSLATGHFLAADLALYFGDVNGALAILAEAGRRFPNEKRTDAFVAWAALFADRFDVAREAAARAFAKAPDTLETQLAAGDVARLDGDYFAARAAFRPQGRCHRGRKVDRRAGGRHQPAFHR